jgi:hypothetical protein
MIINLNGVYYHYCELPLATFEALMGTLHGAVLQHEYQGHRQGWSV